MNWTREQGKEEGMNDFMKGKLMSLVVKLKNMRAVVGLWSKEVEVEAKKPLNKVERNVCFARLDNQ